MCRRICKKKQSTKRKLLTVNGVDNRIANKAANDNNKTVQEILSRNFHIYRASMDSGGDQQQPDHSSRYDRRGKTIGNFRTWKFPSIADSIFFPALCNFSTVDLGGLRDFLLRCRWTGTASRSQPHPEAAHNLLCRTAGKPFKRSSRRSSSCCRLMTCLSESSNIALFDGSLMA